MSPDVSEKDYHLQGNNIHYFHKQSERLTRQTTVHVSTERQSISDEPEPREVGGVSGSC